MKRRAVRATDFLAAAALLWAVSAATPLAWWGYAPGQVFIADADAGQVPQMAFTRTIWRDVRLHYQVVVRELPTLSVACDAASGVFTYRAGTQPPAGGFDLAWWAPQDARCAMLPPGEYQAETCWTAPDLLWGVVPDKTACVVSNVFHVGARTEETK